MSNKIEISYEQYKELLDREEKLSALEVGGVDNWEWYDESLEGYYKKKKLENLVDDTLREILDIVAVSDISCEDSLNGLYIINPDEVALEKVHEDFKQSLDNFYSGRD